LQVFPNLVNDDCQSGSVGRVAAVGIFGTPPYTVVWKNSLGAEVDTDTNLLQGQASNATGLSADTYTVQFTDATGTCQASSSIGVANITIDTSTTLNNATISANATGVTYQWVDCNNGMSDIPDETNSDFTPTANGNYAIKLTKNTCINTSDCVMITTLGVDVNSLSNTFKIYPNPTYGDFSIEYGDSQNSLTFSLYSITGKLILSENSKNASTIKLNIDKPAGTYILKIINAKGEVTFTKIVKK
jgi:hypothetical protein